MIECKSEQGTDGWFNDRLGIPTASMFKSIITSTGKPSTQAGAYMNGLIADVLAGKFLDSMPSTYWMERGTELEPDARELYEFITDNKVDQMGFCYKDDKMDVGCSPDGVIGNDGLIEIKSPKAATVVSYMLGGKVPSDYVPQVQGQLWVMEREWCDFFVYHPDLKSFKIRAYRDDGYIKLLSEAIEKFNNKKNEKIAKLKEAA
jgi:hypothetical protein